MALARWQATIQDEEGNVLPGASVEVRRENSGATLAVLFSDRDGAVSIGNPFTVSDPDGFAFFHVAGGAYRITVTHGAFTRVLRYVGIGLAAESDGLSVFAPAGAWNNFTSYSLGAVVTFDGFVYASNVDGNLAHTPPGVGSPITAGASDSFWTYLAIQGADGADGATGSSDVTGTSASSLAIGTGSKSFTVAELDRGWSVGARLRASSAANPTVDYMEGVVTAYSGSSLTMTVDLASGSGTHADWHLNLAGERGATGATGDTGSAATIQIGTVTSIPPGSPSTSVSNSGTPNAAVFDFEIERGFDGADGADGAPGAAATIQIGTVTSIPPGSPSTSVHNSGTANAAVLDFEIERGVDGADGTDGADGSDPGYLLTFETATSSPPGAGAIRFNNANLASATAAFVDAENRAGSSILARLLELDDALSSTAAVIILTDPLTDAQASFQVVSVVNNTTWAQINVTAHAGATSFANGLAVSLQREIPGRDGADGSGDVSGPVPGSPAISIGSIAVFSDPDGDHIDSSGVSFASVAEVQAAASDRALLAEHLRSASVYEALSDTPTLAIDWTAAINWEVTIGGNRVVGNPTNGIPGTFRNILFKGSSTSSPTEPHAVTFGNQFDGDLPTIADVDIGRWYLVTLICVTETLFSASAKRVFGAA